MNIFNKFIDNQEILKDKTAFIDKNDKKISYSKFYYDISTCIKLIKELNIKKGSKFFIFIPPSYELYVVLIASVMAGVTIVFIDALSERKRINRIIKENPDGILVTNSKLYNILSCISCIRNINNKLFVDKILEYNNELDYEYQNIEYDKNIKLDDEAFIIYTTGSTGYSKKVIRSYNVIQNQFEVVKKNLDVNLGQVVMSGLPMHTLALLLLGVTVVIPKSNPFKISKTKIDKVVEQIQKYNVSTLINSGYFFETLCNYVMSNNITINNLKNIYTGGSFYKISELEKLEEMLKCNINIIYGSTEAFIFCKINNKCYKENYYNNDGIPVGYKLNELDYKVLSDKGTNDDGIGELLVKGDYVSYSNPVEINNKIWHNTGDCVNIESGMIYMLGRKKHIVEYNNVIYYSLALEKLITSRYPKIKNCAVIKDNKGYIRVFIEKRGLNKQSKKDIQKKIKNILSFLRIDYIHFIKIPRDRRHYSRIDYAKLNNMY
ncbi:MAG: acyl--CoA ligase [Romboutsia sp.]|nr:acyl--CoA ligase [Romboutsia sp.]